MINKTWLWCMCLMFLSGCASGTGQHHRQVDANLGFDRIGAVYVARDPDFLAAQTVIDVWLNGGPIATLMPDQYAVGRAHGALNSLQIRASGLGAGFYPSEVYRFSRAGRKNHYFFIDFEHQLTYDRLVLNQVDRRTWLDHVGMHEASILEVGL